MGLNLGMLLRQSAARSGEAVALWDGEAPLSYEQLHDRARRIAGALARLGVRRGRHVALLLPNVPDFTAAYFACHYLGAPVVPLNVMFTADEIAYHLDDSDAVALLAWHELLPQARAAAARTGACRTLVSAGGVPAEAGVVAIDDLVAGADPVDELPDTMPDDTAVLLYTSGTTGRPKGAELTHFNLFYNAEVVSSRLLPMGPETVALAALPLFHSFGQTVMQNAVLMRGGALVLLRRFEPRAALEAMSRRRVTFFAGVPTMYAALLNAPGSEAFDLSRLTDCKSGGAPMPVELMRAFEKRYGVAIYEGYGLSETSPVASFNVRQRPRKPGSIGVPLDGVEFRLVDDAGGVIADPLVPGEICIKGHCVMKGYYKKPEATAEAIRGGWFRTGDVAHRDADGYYFIVDRKKDMILRGGFNVYPREIEEVLYGHPAVLEVAVVGVPHPDLGEEVKAVIVPREGESVTAEDIASYCRQHLAAYKIPRVVAFADALPKGPTGKILKRLLRGPA